MKHKGRTGIEKQVDHHSDQYRQGKQKTRIFFSVFFPSCPQILADHRYPRDRKSGAERHADIQQRPADRHSRLCGHRVLHPAYKECIHKVMKGFQQIGQQHRCSQYGKGPIQILLFQQQITLVPLLFRLHTPSCLPVKNRHPPASCVRGYLLLYSCFHFLWYSVA